MLNEKRIEEIAQEVANANLASVNITSVSSSAAIDSEGHEALRITIVIKPALNPKSRVTLLSILLSVFSIDCVARAKNGLQL